MGPREGLGVWKRKYFPGVYRVYTSQMVPAARLEGHRSETATRSSYPFLIVINASVGELPRVFTVITKHPGHCGSHCHVSECARYWTNAAWDRRCAYGECIKHSNNTALCFIFYICILKLCFSTIIKVWLFKNICNLTL